MAPVLCVACQDPLPRVLCLASPAKVDASKQALGILVPCKGEMGGRCGTVGKNCCCWYVCV